jgi:hypothetical protein
MPPNGQLFNQWRFQSRGLGWNIRAFVECYMATPASAPSWLLPKSYWKAMLDKNQAIADSWGTNYATDHPSLPQYPGLIAQGSGLCVEYEQGFFMDFLMLGLGFAVNQAGLTNWKPYWQFAAKMPIGWASGTSGWDPRFPNPYLYFLQAVSNDYDGSPAAINSFTDAYNFVSNNAIAWQDGSAWSVGTTSNSLRSLFPLWQPSTTYHCNSWIAEVRSGVPVLPHAGDVVSFAITGSFSGSPVTVSHTIDSGDITILTRIAKTGTLSGDPNPICTDLTAKINANSSLAAAGITASTACVNYGVGAELNHQQPGRFYIAFNSDGTSSAGGPVIGAITVTGSFATSTNKSLYIQPNGDGVHLGSQGSNLFGRPLSFQCGKSGTSAGSGGPTGHALQALVADGGTNWCFAPEYKSFPYVVPGGPIDPLPAFGFGGPFGVSGQGPGYMSQAWTAVAPCVTAGLTGASAAYTNLDAMRVWLYGTFDTVRSNRWSLSIAP